jgi:ubiquinone/menaquinone biosynthesis C-methylase UbiE
MMANPLDKSEVAAAYDRWAETYDIDANRTRELAAHVLRQLHHELTVDIVIEIGCGTGYNTQWLSERARSVLALDFSEQMLRRAKARVRSPSVLFMQHDIRSACQSETLQPTSSSQCSCWNTLSRYSRSLPKLAARCVQAENC